MRKPLRPNTAKRKVVGEPRTVLAPFKGWYTLEGDLQMPIGSAKLLDNFWPEADVVSLRKGSLAHVDGMPGRVETLMAYRTGSTAQLFAASDGGIYDVSAAGTAAAPVVPRSVGRCAFTNFVGSGGQFLIVVNGADAPLKYDGTNWTGIAFSDGGPTNPNDISGVWSYRSRLYFLAKDSTKFYYLPADSIGGTLNTFDAGGSLSKGGKLIAGGRWTIDAGNGPDDACVVVSDQGEVLVYGGNNPGSANGWGLVGVYTTGKPIGPRCLINLGGDLCVLCEDGVQPLSTITKLDRSQQKRASATSNIAKAFNETLRQRGAGSDWGLYLWSKGTMLICNVPGVGGLTEQYAMNVQTGAWCRFKGLRATCWEEFEGAVYYGTNDGRVLKFWHGSTDDGAPIDAVMVPAFNQLGYAGVKTLSHMRTDLKASYVAQLSIGVAVDFEINLANVIGLDFGALSSQWDVSPWDTTPWADTDDLRRQAWQGVSGVGYAFAPVLTATTLDRGPNFELTFQAIAFVLVAANGGIL
jgi:hypothetical protein